MFSIEKIKVFALDSLPQILRNVQKNGIPLWGNIIIYSSLALFFIFALIAIIVILKTDFTDSSNKIKLQRINTLVGMTVFFMLSYLISLIILVSYYFE